MCDSGLNSHWKVLLHRISAASTWPGKVGVEARSCATPLARKLCLMPVEPLHKPCLRHSSRSPFHAAEPAH